MPLADAGFRGQDGLSDRSLLLQYGPTISVSVSHYRSDTDAAAGAQPQKEPVSTHALVDTGATQSCIDIGLAQELELPVIDTVEISGSDGAKTHPSILLLSVSPHLSSISMVHSPGLRWRMVGSSLVRCWVGPSLKTSS